MSVRLAGAFRAYHLFFPVVCLQVQLQEIHSHDKNFGWRSIAPHTGNKISVYFRTLEEASHNKNRIYDVGQPPHHNAHTFDFLPSLDHPPSESCGVLHRNGADSSRWKVLRKRPLTFCHAEMPRGNF